MLGTDREELDLGFDDVDDESAISAAKLFRNPENHVKKLSLHARLSAVGVRRIAAALKDRNCKVENITLSSCSIGDVGVSRIATSLRDVGCRVTDICLQKCGMTCDGATEVANTLQNPNNKIRQRDWRCWSFENRYLTERRQLPSYRNQLRGLPNELCGSGRSGECPERSKQQSH